MAPRDRLEGEGDVRFPLQTEIEVTPQMIEAGVLALNEEIGYDYNGSPEGAAEAVFLAMFRVAVAAIACTAKTSS